MTLKPYGKSINNLVHINRITIAELDIAIEELEARGYELVKRDDKESVSDVKDYHYQDNIGAKWKYSGSSESVKRCRATMKRIIPYVRDVHV
ncbi:MAG: hypothetical protein ABS938_09820 [Psychrobacillus psychrodurans]